MHWKTTLFKLKIQRRKRSAGYRNAFENHLHKIKTTTTTTTTTTNPQNEQSEDIFHGNFRCKPKRHLIIMTISSVKLLNEQTSLKATYFSLLVSLMICFFRRFYLSFHKGKSSCAFTIFCHQCSSIFVVSILNHRKRLYKLITFSFDEICHFLVSFFFQFRGNLSFSFSSDF